MHGLSAWFLCSRMGFGVVALYSSNTFGVGGNIEAWGMVSYLIAQDTYLYTH